MENDSKRCRWVKLNDPLYIAYHDNEWGKPLHGNRELFELLSLETQQAGLSWQTILHKRESYRKAFKNFDIEYCASLSDEALEVILAKGKLIKNRAKIFAVRDNAKAALGIIKEFGSLDAYFWRGNVPIKHSIKHYKDVPTRNDFSDELAKDMKNRGFKFIGSVTLYAFLQSAGIVNDHENDCAFAGK